MPGSERGVQVKWEDPLAFGRYTASVSLERGYRESESSTDSMTITFWVLPWKIVVALVLAIIIVIFVFRKLFSKFEIRKK